MRSLTSQAIIERCHKVLQDANVKVSSILSDIFGETGRIILNQINFR